MAAKDLILSIDQGTTSTRAIAFTTAGDAVATAQKALPQIYPADGWVEHDPEEIWSATVEVCRKVLGEVDAERVGAIGITNQRETTVLWDRQTGKPIHNAIVWQDRRGAPLCRKLIEAGHEPMIQQKTGLLIDSYFSATKIAWLLENVAGAKARAEQGELAFGTIDSFLLWRLTGGKVHATDITNACRTMLFDIHKKAWDADLLKLFGVPRSLLPEVKPNAGVFGTSETSGIGVALPIAGMAGDQQAATFGQACFGSGEAKNTYGTGCFLLMNTGEQAVESKHNLLTTIGWGNGGKVTYCLEGSVFVAGAAVQWLRDGLGLIRTSAEVEALAQSVPDSDGVVLVPAFVGLGAPYWDPYARGAVLGIIRLRPVNTDKLHAFLAPRLDPDMLEGGISMHLLESDPGLSKSLTDDGPNPGAADWFVLIDGTDVKPVSAAMALRFDPLDLAGAGQIISSGIYRLMWDLAKSDL